MPVGAMLRQMDSAEITEWMAYFRLESGAPKKPEDEDEVWRRAFNAYG